MNRKNSFRRNPIKLELKKVNSISNRTGNFGVHLMLDGYGGDPKLLNDMSLVFNVLNDLPEKIKMRKLMPPYVVYAPPISEKDSGGYSGFVMIAESHISVHTFPRKKFVSVDVYTCKNNLSEDFILKFFKDAFKLKEIEAQSARRGLNFPEKDLI